MKGPKMTSAKLFKQENQGSISTKNNNEKLETLINKRQPINNRVKQREQSENLSSY